MHLKKNILVAAIASLGIIFAAAYMLWLYRRVVFGRIANTELKKMTDLSNIELYIFSSLGFLILFFGVYPEPLLNTVSISIDNLINNYEMNLKFHLALKGN